MNASVEVPSSPPAAPTPPSAPATELPAAPLPSPPTGNVGSHASSSVSDPRTTAAAASRNPLLTRRVDRLTGTTLNDGMCELVEYVEDAVPAFFTAHVGEEGGTTTTAAAGLAYAQALRAALDGRTTGMHQAFLKEFGVLYNTFLETADQVHNLEKQCMDCETALGVAKAQGASELVLQINTLQAELELAQRRQQEVKEFREQFNFGKREQDYLETEPVTTAFLDVLDEARSVHERSRRLLLSREPQQSAAAVMEATYTAIMRATDRIVRFLLSSTAAAGNARYGSTDTESMGITASMAADVPEVSSFFLRCVAVLRAENPMQWAKVVEEVARLRRASVLRRYFHLLTTGSATTSTGTYRAGGGWQGSSHTGRGDAEPDGALRPLEAELDHPVFFFSALCAWLHQSLVEEEDFLSLFFPTTPGATADVTREGLPAARHPDSAGIVAEGLLDMTPANDLTAYPDRVQLLDFVFDGLTKHINTALRSVLERFVRTASSLGESTAMGPRGLTGGLTKLIVAATGRPRRGGPVDDGSQPAMLQRYQTVSTWAQQESMAAALLRSPLSGLRTCSQLLQLFSYHGATTLIPLLGRQSSLTQLLTESAAVELQAILQNLVKLLSGHLFDSVAGAVYRLPVLRRLAAAYSMEQRAAHTKVGGSGTATSGDAASNGDGSGALLGPKRYVLDYLFRHSPESHSELESSGFLTGSAGAYGGASDPQQRAAATELTRSLDQLILPASAEVQACLQLLQVLMQEADRQQQLLEALELQQRTAHPHTGVLDGAAVQTAQPAHEVVGAQEADKLHFVGLVQTLLGFPVLLAQQVTVSGTLDDPCLCILQYNCYAALLAVLHEFPQLLARVMPANAGDHTLEHGVRTEMKACREALCHHLIASATTHYFTTPSAVVQSATAPLDAALRLEVPKYVRRALFQLYNFYSLMAATGKLPPLPLLSSWQGVGREDSAEAIQQAVTEGVRRAYEDWYVAVAALNRKWSDVIALTPEEATAFEDMMPRKLAVLMAH